MYIACNNVLHHKCAFLVFRFAGYLVTMYVSYIYSKDININYPCFKALIYRSIVFFQWLLAELIH